MERELVSLSGCRVEACLLQDRKRFLQEVEVLAGAWDTPQWTRRGTGVPPPQSQPSMGLTWTEFCYEGPRRAGVAEEGGDLRALPSPSYLPGSPASQGPCPTACCTPSHLPKLLQGSFVARAPEGGIFHALPFSFSALLRPRQRFIPSPRLVAFGAERS